VSGRERTVDPRVVKALGHPLRQRVLARLNEGVASPSELAAEFGERLPNVSYHVRILADLGAIELVSTTPRRGAVEHHYRATMRPFFSAEDWATLPASTRRAVVDGTLGEVFKDVSEAASAGGFDDDLVHVSRSPMALDGQGFEELATLLESTIEQAARIQADSAERLKAGSEDEVSGVELVLMGFRTAPR
jgi:DNA-binding transcriptional ArsR family regulator